MAKKTPRQIPMKKNAASGPSDAGAEPAAGRMVYACYIGNHWAFWTGTGFVPSETKTATVFDDINVLRKYIYEDMKRRRLNGLPAVEHFIRGKRL